MHEHDHHDHSNHVFEAKECQECINFENCDNSILDFQEVNFSNNNTDIFFLEYFISIQFNTEQRYHSRAPPIS